MARFVNYIMNEGPCKGDTRPAIVVSENEEGEDPSQVQLNNNEVMAKPDAKKGDTPAERQGELDSNPVRDADGGRRIEGTVNLLVFCDRDKDNVLREVAYRANVSRGKEPGNYK